ncbi:MAG: Dabb family protein [Geminicoccaceae bacterium]
MSTATKLRHVVMFGFKEGTTDADIDEIVRRFLALRDLVPGIDDFEWGVNNSPEGKSQGRTHCFTLTFNSTEARDAYLPHPDHMAFVGFARQWIEHVTVLDYWARNEVP